MKQGDIIHVVSGDWKGSVGIITDHQFSSFFAPKPTDIIVRIFDPGVPSGMLILDSTTAVVIGHIE